VERQILAPSEIEERGIKIHKNNSPEIAELAIVFILLY
jgi:hypothetical protein